MSHEAKYNISDAPGAEDPPPATNAPKPRRLSRAEKRAVEIKNKVSSPWASALALLLALLWTIPTFGLLVTSFRPVKAIKSTGWWTGLGGPFTLENYEAALTRADTGLGTYFVNSFVITIPAVVIPILVALVAAYAFAWIDFPGRNILFVAVFALQVVPIQVTLVPLLTQFTRWGIGGTYWAVWMSHSMFALPLAIFLLHNFMKEIPASLIEAARVDGAGHVRIFFQVLMPLMLPAIASFAIFQFLWVWNDLLVAITFGDNPSVKPLTAQVANMVGSRGNDWHLLSSGAFISMLVPMIVFLALQRFFVRGMLAGSVKG